MARKAVSPSSYRDEEVMRPRETDRGPDVRHVGAAHNQRRVSVDPHPSVLLIAPVTWTDELTVQRLDKFLDGTLVNANLFGPG
jgi:hypothetical protein